MEGKKKKEKKLSRSEKQQGQTGKKKELPAAGEMNGSTYAGMGILAGCNAGKERKLSLTEILRTFFPMECPLCGGVPFDDSPGMFCADCLLSLEFTQPPYCPGCGGTRAVRLLLTGHIWKSFLHHPGVLFAAALYLWFMVSQTIERLSKGKLEVGLPYSDRFLYWEIVVILIQCLIKNLVKIFWGIGIL